jgi:hypothetical protein
LSKAKNPLSDLLAEAGTANDVPTGGSGSTETQDASSTVSESTVNENSNVETSTTSQSTDTLSKTESTDLLTGVKEHSEESVALDR